MEEYLLECRYDTRKSFYAKAKVQREYFNDSYAEARLISYGTEVAKITYDFDDYKIYYKYYGKYSQTTTRHQKEFFKQAGLSDKEIKDLFKKGLLIKEEVYS